MTKYCLTDSHSPTVYCNANSVAELESQFDMSEYRVTKRVFEFEEGYGHHLISEEIL